MEGSKSYGSDAVATKVRVAVAAATVRRWAASTAVGPAGGGWESAARCGPGDEWAPAAANLAASP